MSDVKFEIQESQYSFPYHYIPFIYKGRGGGEIPRCNRILQWGFEYLSYTKVVIDEINQLDFNSILDVGCGDGYLLNHIETEADKIGIDLSEKAIKFAQAFSKDTKFEVKDIFCLEKEYDLISLIEVMEHIPDDIILPFMTKVVSLIKTGGYLIVCVPTTVMPLSKKHYRHYDENLLSEHIEQEGNVELIKERRVYKNSKLLKFLIRLLNNKFFSINYSVILKFFWEWNLKNNIDASRTNGCHIVRVYKKL